MSISNGGLHVVPQFQPLEADFNSGNILKVNSTESADNKGRITTSMHQTWPIGLIPGSQREQWELVMWSQIEARRAACEGIRILVILFQELFMLVESQSYR